MRWLCDSQCTSVSDKRGGSGVGPRGANVDPGPKADASSVVAVRHTSLRTRAPMMSVPLHRAGREGGCPIKMAVRRPCQRPSSPPDDIATDDREVIALVLPDVKDDLREAARQRHPGHFLPAPLFHRVKPRPQRAGLPHRLRRGQHQDPAQEAIAFLGDVAGAHPPGTAAHPRRQADVAGDPLSAREPLDVAELEDEDDRDEGARCQGSSSSVARADRAPTARPARRRAGGSAHPASAAGPRNPRGYDGASRSRASIAARAARAK
jgi:hypothetical protein